MRENFRGEMEEQTTRIKKNC